MKRVVLLFALALTLTLPAQAAAQSPRTIEIEGSDAMKYSVAEITASPGEQVRVVLTSAGVMPKIAMAHNFVLLRAGVDAAQFAIDSVMEGPATSYIAAARAGDVIAFTELAGAGETVEVSFEAPAAGVYTFLCTFPGHYAAGMTGTLIVK